MGNTMTPILKLANFCNFDCGFCRYAQGNMGGALMPMDVARSAISSVAKYNLAQGTSAAHVIFHGGEPLLWSKENFRKIHEFEKGFCSANPGFRFFNSIQTNGFLIDEEWAHLFAEMEMDVGISHDGPGELNSHLGKGGSTDIARVVELLDSNRVRHGILSVVTNAHRDRAREYYDFLQESGIRSVGLCYCFDPDGDHTVDNVDLAKFLIELFDLYFFGDYELNVREFENAILGVLRKDIPSCCNKCRTLCGKHFTVLPSGDMQFCDSYEIDAEHLDNIMCGGIEDYLASTEYIKVLQRLQQNYAKHCLQCDVHDICRGGCFRNDLEDGSNCFCGAYKALYRHIREVVEDVAAG